MVGASSPAQDRDMIERWAVLSLRPSSCRFHGGTRVWGHFMILNNISKAIREQNYYAVALEFVIVVAGVLLAFQVSSWSQAASDRAYTRDVLARVHNELVGLSEIRAGSVAFRAERLAHLLEARPIVMGVVDAETLTPEQCVAIAVSDTGAGAAPDGIPSLDELMTSGALSSIQSADLRQSAMELYAKRGVVRAYTQESVHNVVNLAIAFPDAVQRKLIPDPGETDDGWDVSATCDLAAMQASPAFQAALLENIYTYRTSVDYVYGFIDEAIATLRDDLERDLGLSAEPAP